MDVFVGGTYTNFILFRCGEMISQVKATLNGETLQEPVRVQGVMSIRCVEDDVCETARRGGDAGATQSLFRTKQRDTVFFLLLFEVHIIVAVGVY